MGTRIWHHHPKKLEVIAAHFMQTVCPKVVGASRNQDFILNMDQLPITVTFDRQRTLESVGAHTVSICKSTCDTKQATLAVTITALGRMVCQEVLSKGFPYLSMQVYLCMSVFILDG